MDITDGRPASLWRSPRVRELPGLGGEEQQGLPEAGQGEALHTLIVLIANAFCGRRRK